MSLLDPKLPYHDLTSDAFVAPGRKLFILCASILHQQRSMSEWEKTILTECFHSGAQSPHFCAAFIKSLRLVLGAVLKAKESLNVDADLQDKTRFLDMMAFLCKKAALVAILGKSLDNEADIVPTTIRAFLHLHQYKRMRHDKLYTTISCLLRSGARINGTDQVDKTALFYACFYGDHELFQLLIKAGADTSTVYPAPLTTTRPKSLWYDCNTSQIQVSQNLFQVTLDAMSRDGLDTSAEWRSGHDRGLVTLSEWRLGRKYGRIAADLNRMGVSCGHDDRGLVASLHAACYQGERLWVEWVLKRFGVSIHTPGRSDGPTQRYFASSLHAAAAGAQAEIIRLLLSLGADPVLKGHSTCEDSDCDGHILTALGMVPVEGYRMCGNLKIRPKTDSERDAIRETIDILLNFQADAEECLTLLETAIRTGQAAIVKRLLKLDYRMSTAAHATSSETTIALLGHDRTIYLGRMQRQAVEAGDQTVLLQLIEKFGDALASVSPRKLCKLALSHDHFDMFRFLVSRYVSDINKIWHDETQEIGETLLQMACVLYICELDFCNHRECSRPASTQAISFLLQAGADPMREQTEDAWTKFQRALNSQRIEPQHIMSVWPTLRQLERHMPPSHAIDLRKAWRANSERKLRSKIDEEISRQPISLYSATSESGLASNDSCDVTEIQQQARTDLTTGVAHQQPPRAAPTPRPNEVEFKHSPLTGPYKSAIRILTLQPSEEFDALIECLVTEVDLAELPFYKTLSYVWGTKSASKYISVNGKTLRIFENLHDALKRLRNTSGPQNLWIDAICIDQDNFGERSRQVEIMGDIYRHARGVVIWLGEHAEDSQYCFQDEVSVYKMNARAKAAFDRLCQREWFFRTWVIQELALSKCAFIKCGPDTADWDHFFPRGLGGLGFHPLHGWDSWDRIEELNWLRLPGSGEYVRLPNYSRSCRSTDPKDRICGILGLFPPGLMRVHYNLTLQEVFTQFASAVIQWTGNIRLIHDYSVRDTLPGPPSWVPDFNSMTLAGTLPRKDSHFVERLNKKAASLAVNGRQLLIKGMVVDSIKQIGSEMFISTEYAVGTPAFRRVMLEWETSCKS